MALAIVVGWMGVGTITPVVAAPAKPAPVPWHLPGWAFRAAVRLKQKQSVPADCRSAWVRIYTCGRSRPDRADLRLVDATTTHVPFHVDYHDPLVSTLLTFRMVDPKQTLYVYFGNPKATPINAASPNRALHQARARLARWMCQWNALGCLAVYGLGRAHAGAVVGMPRVPVFSPAALLGRPASTLPPTPIHAVPAPAVSVPGVESAVPRSWEPDRGLIVRTLRKKDPNEFAKNLDHMKKIIREAVEVYGARYTANPALGYNPWGSSDGYITIFDGILFVPKTGRYGFCTASDESSFLLIDGKPTVQWPGRHAMWGGYRGEHRGYVQLAAGPHRFTYYHEEVNGDQMAFAGWCYPPMKGYPKLKTIKGRIQMVGFPPQQFPSPAEFVPGQTERGDGKPCLADFRIDKVVTAWLRDAPRPTQFSQVQLRSTSSTTASKIASHQWVFDDGTTMDGEGKASHVYLKEGRPIVRLTVKDDKGHTDSCVLGRRIYLVDVQHSHHNRFDYQYARQENFYKEVQTYDPNKLDQKSLEGLVEFMHGMKDHPRHWQAAQSLFTRFKDLGAPQHVYRLKTEAGRAALHRDVWQAKAAIALFRTASELKGVNWLQKHRALLAVAYAQWHHLRQYDAASKTYQQTLNEYRKLKSKDKHAQQVARSVIIGLGDVLLEQVQLKPAVDQYRQILKEWPPGKKFHHTEEVDKGSFPYTSWEFIEDNNLQDALDFLDKWESKYPWHKLEGMTFYLRAKVLFVQGHYLDAVEFADRSLIVAPRSEFAADNMWLKAQAYQNEAARAKKAGQEARKKDLLDKAIGSYVQIIESAAGVQYQKVCRDKIKECKIELGELKPDKPKKK